MSGNRNKRYLPTKTALAWLTAMNRQSSNRVKISKIATRAMKLTRKLTANVRNRLASIKFGNPQLPTVWARQALATGLLELALRRLTPHRSEVNNGIRLVMRNNKLKDNINPVPIHGPARELIVPARESESPNSEDR